jgi:hypothetical protein
LVKVCKNKVTEDGFFLLCFLSFFFGSLGGQWFGILTFYQTADRQGIWGGRLFGLILGKEPLIVVVYSYELVRRRLLLPGENLSGFV